MMIKETSLRRDPDLRGELAFLAKGCDFVLPSRFKKRLKIFQQTQVQNKQEKKLGTPLVPAASVGSSPQPLSPLLHVNNAASNVPLSVNIPRFYFPKGLPDACANHEQTINRIEKAFMEIEDQKADIYEMGKIAKACGCPFYWKAPMFNAAGGERTGFVSVHSFIAMWRKLLYNCHDDASKFVYLLAKPNCSCLEQEDFIPLLQDVVDTHPGLTFLKDAPEFHSRYITTIHPLVKDSPVVAEVLEPCYWFRSPEEGFSCCMFTEILEEDFANVFRGPRIVLQSENELMRTLAMYLLSLLSFVSPGTEIAENLPPVKMKKRPLFGY